MMRASGAPTDEGASMHAAAVVTVLFFAETATAPPAPSPRAAGAGCEGKTGSTWIRCVAAAPQAEALGRVLDRVKSYPNLVPEAAGTLALTTNPERLLELAREAELPPQKSSGPITDWSARLRGALAALGVVLQRAQSVAGVRLPGDLADRMLACCERHATDARASMAEAALKCAMHVRDERGARVLWNAAFALKNEDNRVTALSLLSERGQPPDPAQARWLVEQVALPIDPEHWTQPELRRKELACRLLRRRPAGLDEKQREQLAATVTALRPLRSQAADACDLLLSLPGFISPRGGAAAPPSRFRPRKLAFAHVVQAGDTLSAINARLSQDPFANGLDIYADALNEGFRRANPHPDHLEPGGVLRVPDHESWIAIQVKGHESQPYRLFLEGIEVSGAFTTDASGRTITTLPPTSKHMQVALPGKLFRFTLSMDPPDSITGMQQRLHNLGFDVEQTGELDAQTRAAVGHFQSAHGLERTGELNEETRTRINDEYGR